MTAPASSAAPFVLNLCSSTTPMALAQTDLPELKRFTFFVSRRFEEGRERFRLHMGYFSTLAEAEEWLSVVREIYPGAWAGEAPGRKLRERAAAAAADQARHAAGPQPRVAPAPSRAPAPAPAAAAARPAAPNPADVRVPVVHAALPAARRAAAPPLVAPPVARAAAPRTVAPRITAPAPAPKPAAGRAPPPPFGAQRAAARTPPRTPAAASSGAAPAAGKSAKPVFEDSNVREVLAALGDACAAGAARGAGRGQLPLRHAGVENAREPPPRERRAAARRRRARQHSAAQARRHRDASGTQGGRRQQRAGVLCGAVAMVGAAGRARQGTSAGHLQRLHPLYRRGQPRRPQVVWAAPRVLQRHQFRQTGRPLRALGVRFGRGGAGESAGEEARDGSGPEGRDPGDCGRSAPAYRGRVQAHRRRHGEHRGGGAAAGPAESASQARGKALRQAGAESGGGPCRAPARCARQGRPARRRRQGGRARAPWPADARGNPRNSRRESARDRRRNRRDPQRLRRASLAGRGAEEFAVHATPRAPQRTDEEAVVCWSNSASIQRWYASRLGSRPRKSRTSCAAGLVEPGASTDCR